MITVEFAFDLGDTVLVKPLGRHGIVYHLALTHERRQVAMIEDTNGNVLGSFYEEQLQKVPA